MLGAREEFRVCSSGFVVWVWGVGFGVWGSGLVRGDFLKD